MKKILFYIALLTTLSFTEQVTKVFQNGTNGYDGCEDVVIGLEGNHVTYKEVLNTPDSLKNYNGGSILRVMAGNVAHIRILIKFNDIIDTIPQNSVVIDAKITFIKGGNVCDDESVACFSPLIADWDVDEATWLESSDGKYWPVDSTQYTNYFEGEPEIDKIFHGGLYDVEVVTRTPGINSPSKQYPGKESEDADVTEAVQQMVDGTRENYGFLGFEQRALTRSKYRYPAVYSSSETDCPPCLTVVYDPDSVRVNTVHEKSVAKQFTLTKTNGFTALNFTHSDSYNLSIFDVMGKELKSISFFGTKIKIAHNEFSKGLHIISVVGSNGEIFRDRLLF